MPRRTIRSKYIRNYNAPNIWAEIPVITTKLFNTSHAKQEKNVNKNSTSDTKNTSRDSYDDATDINSSTRKSKSGNKAKGDKSRVNKNTTKSRYGSAKTNTSSTKGSSKAKKGKEYDNQTNRQANSYVDPIWQTDLGKSLRELGLDDIKLNDIRNEYNKSSAIKKIFMRFSKDGRIKTAIASGNLAKVANVTKSLEMKLDKASRDAMKTFKSSMAKYLPAGIAVAVALSVFNDGYEVSTS